MPSQADDLQRGQVPEGPQEAVCTCPTTHLEATLLQVEGRGCRGGTGACS